MPRSPWMGASGALDNTQGYSTYSENPSANQISNRSYAAIDKTFELEFLRNGNHTEAASKRLAAQIRTCFPLRAYRSGPETE